MLLGDETSLCVSCARARKHSSGLATSLTQHSISVAPAILTVSFEAMFWHFPGARLSMFVPMHLAMLHRIVVPHEPRHADCICFVFPLIPRKPEAYFTAGGAVPRFCLRQPVDATVPITDLPPPPLPWAGGIGYRPPTEP